MVSAGGGAASGAASGAAAGAVFGPWGAVIGGIAGGIMGLVGAGKQNKAQLKAAKLGQESENNNLVQARLQTYDQGRLLGQQTSGDMGRLNNLPGYARGAALTAVIGQLGQDRALDQLNLDQGLDYRTRATEINKANIRAGAQANMVSPWMSAAQGALSMASAGYGLGNSIDSMNRASDLNTAMQNAKTPEQAQALALGIPESSLGTVDQLTATQQAITRLANEQARQQALQQGLSFAHSIFQTQRNR